MQWYYPSLRSHKGQGHGGTSSLYKTVHVKHGGGMKVWTWNDYNWVGVSWEEGPTTGMVGNCLCVNYTLPRVRSINHEDQLSQTKTCVSNLLTYLLSSVALLNVGLQGNKIAAQNDQQKFANLLKLWLQNRYLSDSLSDKVRFYVHQLKQYAPRPSTFTNL